MKTLCQEYISNVKSFFPIINKEERIFLANLTDTVNNFCEEEDINTITDLYNKFGLPNEVVNSYYSSQDIKHILKNINTARLLKIGALIFLVISVIIASISNTNIYLTKKALKEQDIRTEKLNAE